MRVLLCLMNSRMVAHEKDHTWNGFTTGVGSSFCSLILELASFCHHDAPT